MNRLIRILLTLMLALIVLFPLIYGFSASFFSPIDFTDSYAHMLPSDPSFRNYGLALSHRHFLRYVMNSTITSALTVALRIMVTLPAAFALTHFTFRGRKALFIMLLSTLFIPSDAILYENYATIASLRLLDTYAAIILPSVFSASAILMLYGALSSLDKDVYDAARIDGAGCLRYLISILAPLSQPYLVAIAIQTYISSFNSYLWPLLVTNRDSMRTVQVGLTMLGFAEQGERGAQFASIMVITIPFLIVLAFGRKVIMKSLSRGRDII